MSGAMHRPITAAAHGRRPHQQQFRSVCLPQTWAKGESKIAANLRRPSGFASRLRPCILRKIIFNVCEGCSFFALKGEKGDHFHIIFFIF